LKGLFEVGAFGMKIPKEYGGLGFSYTNYGRVLTLISSWSNILSLTVAVPQSIGIAMPILLFGNEAQKRTYLPRVAREAISAFALTESITGSDAANIQTEAVLDRAGSHFLANGEKLWCTHGPIARYVRLIARVPAKQLVRDVKPALVAARAADAVQRQLPYHLRQAPGRAADANDAHRPHGDRPLRDGGAGVARVAHGGPEALRHPD